MANWYRQSGYGDAKGLQESIVPPCIAFFDVFGVDTESIPPSIESRAWVAGSPPTAPKMA